MLPYLLLLLVSISLAAVGQILLKAGLSQLDHPSVSQIMLSMFHNGSVFFGYAAFVFSSLVWLVALRHLPLSYAYPMVSLGYVAVVLLSWKVFGEAIPPLRVVALVTILTGVVLLALSEDTKHVEEHGAAPVTSHAGAAELPHGPS